MVNNNHCLVGGTPADKDFMNQTITQSKCSGVSDYISTIERTPGDIVY